MNTVQIKELVVVATAVAVTIIVIFIAAIANAGKFSAASRADNVIGIDFIIEADGVAASGAFHFDKIVVAAAVAIIIVVAIAAIAFVFVDLVVIFFESAEIFVDFFDIGFKVFSVFLETADRVCDIAKNVKNCGNYLIITFKTFSKTFDISNFFRNVHDFEPLYHAARHDILSL